MLFQTCINLFIVLNTKEDILKNMGNQTWETHSVLKQHLSE